MKIFLKLKGAQLFILVVGLFILSLFMLGRPFRKYFQLYAHILFSILGYLIFLGWDWTVGIHLNKIVPERLRLQTTLFKFVLFAKAILIIVNLVKSIWFPVYNEPINPIFYILFAIGIFCSFYIIFFIAKSLALAEKESPVSFKDYGGDCVGLFFWIVGIWTIQERINRLFRYENKKEEIPNQENSTDGLQPPQI